MRNLNRVTLIGRLGKDPELQRFESGAVKVTFSLATSESYMDREGIRREITEWHNIVMWRKLAEIAEQYLRKGNLVFLEGKLRTRSWDDQQGNKRYITEIECNNMIMLGGNRTDEARPNTGAGAAVAAPTAQVVESTPEHTDEVDDLPF